MNNYWVNFVKKGNPNGEGVPDWPAYDKSAGNIMEIGDQSVVSPGLFKDDFRFLERAMIDKK